MKKEALCGAGRGLFVMAFDLPSLATPEGEYLRPRDKKRERHTLPPLFPIPFPKKPPPRISPAHSW